MLVERWEKTIWDSSTMVRIWMMAAAAAIAAGVVAVVVAVAEVRAAVCQTETAAMETAMQMVALVWAEVEATSVDSRSLPRASAGEDSSVLLRRAAAVVRATQCARRGR